MFTGFVCLLCGGVVSEFVQAMLPVCYMDELGENSGHDLHYSTRRFSSVTLLLVHSPLGYTKYVTDCMT